MNRAVLTLAWIFAACGGGLVPQGPARPFASCDTCQVGIYATGSLFLFRSSWWASCRRDPGPLPTPGEDTSTHPCNDVDHTVKFRCKGVPCETRRDGVIATAAGKLTVEVELIPKDGGAHEVLELGPYPITTPTDAKATCSGDRVSIQLRTDGGYYELGVHGVRPRVAVAAGACKFVSDTAGTLTYKCPTRPGDQRLEVETLDAKLLALMECP